MARGGAEDAAALGRAGPGADGDDVPGIVLQARRPAAALLLPRFHPRGRVSSAYGYAQAKDETWADYKREAGGWGASRDDFADALDFMGWYIQKSQRVNGVSKWDAYGQYLNYHEGWGGYRNRSYDAKPWLKNVSQKVQSRASLFGAQYRSCQQELSRGGWFW